MLKVETLLQKIQHVFSPTLSAFAVWSGNPWLCIEADAKISWMLGLSAAQAKSECSARGLSWGWIESIGTHCTGTPDPGPPPAKKGSKLQSWQRDVWRPTKAWKKAHPKGQGRGKHWMSLGEYERRRHGKAVSL